MHAAIAPKMAAAKIPAEQHSRINTHSSTVNPSYREPSRRALAIHSDASRPCHPLRTGPMNRIRSRTDAPSRLSTA
jgi:hypothetical protein